MTGSSFVLIDTSVWIGLLNGKIAPPSLEDLPRLATCPPVMQELLQGIGQTPDYERFRRDIFALRCIGDPVTTATFVHAAEIFRRGRRQGFTIRSSVDCLIAAIAIENRLALWHADRDFTAIAQYTDLVVIDKLQPRKV